MSKSMRLPGKRIDFDIESTEKQFHAAVNCVPAWSDYGFVVQAIGFLEHLCHELCVWRSADTAFLRASVSKSMRLPGKRIDFDTESIEK